MAAKKKLTDEMKDDIILSVDTELSSSWNYGSDDLSYLRREYIDRYFRIDDGSEEEGFSSYHSNLIKTHVLQARSYLMRPFNKSKSPIVKFPEEKSTAYIDYLFRYELRGRHLLSSTAWNGLLLKTWAVKVGVSPQMVVEEDYVVFEGDNRKEVEKGIDEFFADNEDDGIEQVGDIEWEEEKISVEVIAPEAPPVPQEAPQALPEAGPVPPEAREVLQGMLEPQEEEPEPISKAEGTVFKAIARFKKERVENRPFVDVIPPYEFHISRQAPTQYDAAFVGRVTPMTMTEMKAAFPDAPKLNGYKGKKQEEKFWDELSGEWLGWTQQNEWYEMWLKDNSSYYEGYYFNTAVQPDSPAHAYLIADVDIQLDYEKKGVTKWYNVIKAGQMLLSCDPISQPSFKVGSPIDIAGRWLGDGLADLTWDEDTSITNLFRAAENAVLQATYTNPIVDQEQIELEDVINRAPDSIIRRKLNAVPKQGVPAIEQLQFGGPDGNTFSLIEKYQEVAGTATGAGKFFQGHDADNISTSRVSGETANVIENNSDLMLDEISSNFWDFWSEVLMMLHNACVMGKASPLSFEWMGKPITVDPIEDMPIVKVAHVQLTVGSNEEADAMEKAEKVLKGIMELEAIPSVANLVTPEGKSLAVLDYFRKLGVDEEMLEVFVQPQTPNDALNSPEVQQAIAEAQQQAQAQAQQEIEAFKNSLEVQMKQAEFDHKVRMDNERFEFEREQAAAKLAADFDLREQQQQKLDDTKEKDAATLGISEEKLELDMLNSDREYELAKRPDPVRTEL